MRMPSLGSRALAAAFAFVLGLAVLLRPDPALAQVGAALDSAVTALETVLRQAGDTLGFWARQLLLGLVVLDLVWRGGKWAMSGQSVGEFAEPMIYTIGILGLTWGFTTVAPDVVGWMTWQATVLSNAAQPGAGSALSPSGLLDDGLGRAFEWVEAASLVNPKSWALLLCAFIALVMMAAELAMVILVYAEIHLVGLVGIATLGFAGLSQTRGVATRYVMTMVGKGFKLMTLLLVVDATHGLAQAAEEVTRFAAQDVVEVRGVVVASPDDEPSVTVAGVMAAVLLQMIGVALMVTLPGAVQRLVSGAAVGDVAGTGGRMVAGAAVSGGAAAAGAAAAGSMGAMSGAVHGAAAARDQGGKAMARSAGIRALQGAVNWGALGGQGRVLNELGSRLSDRVNRMGAGKTEDGPEGGS